MQQYLARRIMLGAVTALLVSLIIFAILRIAPGDVAMMVATGGDPEASTTEEQLELIRERLGLKHPLPVQYFNWLKGIATLDWGTSMFNDLSVWGEFRKKLPVTLTLAIFSVTLSTILGIPVGIIMALKQDSWIDYGFRIFSLAGLSIPNFWLGTMVLVGGMYWFNWIPRIGYVDFIESPISNLKQLFWPALILGYSAMATKARMMRSTMLEVLRQDYIRTAHAKGLKNSMVVYRHAMKNAFIPVITVIGVSIAGILGGSVIIERIFVLPGMGNFLVEGMNNRDYPVVQSLVLVFALWIVMTNLVVDLTYGWLDPRIRYD